MENLCNAMYDIKIKIVILFQINICNESINYETIQ